MSETRGLVKCILGFVLAILVIVGASFGLDVQVNVEDAAPTQSDVVETDEVEPTTEETDVSATEEVVETEQSPADSTPAEDEDTCVDESVEADVTTTTDEPENTVTE